MKSPTRATLANPNFPSFCKLGKILKYILIPTFKNPKIKLGKMNFSLVKVEFWSHWKFCAYHRLFDMRKCLDSQTISKSKSAYITKLIRYVTYKKFQGLNEIILFGFSHFLWPWKLTFSGHWMNIFSIFPLMTYLNCIFFTRSLYFHHKW